MPRRLENWRDLIPELMLLLFFGLVYFWNTTAFDIDVYSEIFHIQAAKESAMAGRFWIPIIQGEDYLIRSPLWTWVVTLFFDVLGVSLWAARFPAMICMLSALVLLYTLALELSKSRATAFSSAAVLGSTWGFFQMGQWATGDILALNIYLGFLWLLIRQVEKSSQGFRTPKRIHDYSLTLGLLLGALLLLKGSFSVVTLLVIALAYLRLTDSLEQLRDLNPRRLAVGLLGIPLPWLLWVSLHTGNWGFGFEYLVIQPLARLTGTGPWQGLEMDLLFYLKRLPFLLMPYLLLLPGALMDGVFSSSVRAFARREPWPMWLLSWFLIGLLLCSVSVFKEPSMMLPFFPPVAILAGYYLGWVLESPDAPPTYQNTLTGCILALMLGAVLWTVMIFQVLPSDYVAGFWQQGGQPLLESLTILGKEFPLEEPFPLWKFQLVPGPFIFLAGGLFMFVALVIRRLPLTVFAWFGTFLVFLLFVKLFYFPIMHRPVAPKLAYQLNREVQAEDRVVLYSLHPDIKRIMFYLKPEMASHTYLARSPEELTKILTAGPGTVYGIIRQRSFFEELDYKTRYLLRVDQFNWKWDMSRLGELRKMLLVRQPMFDLMKSELVSFQSLPFSVLSEIQTELSTEAEAHR